MFLVNLYRSLIPEKLRQYVYRYFLGEVLFWYRKTSLSLFLYNKEWRKRNKHNLTSLCGHYPFDMISVGNYSSGQLRINYFTANERLKIGCFCSIADGVKFITGGNHFTNRFLTYGVSSICPNPNDDGYTKGDICIEDDVWIATNVLILSGVTIGKGAVIAAGAVVVKDIPPYAIAGGNPAKVIKYRFSPDIIDELLKIDFNLITKKRMLDKLPLFYKTISSSEKCYVDIMQH